jgi:hypothetical protein
VIALAKLDEGAEHPAGPAAAEKLNEPAAAATSIDAGAEDDDASVSRILKTTTYCALFAAGGHVLIWIGYLINAHTNSKWIPWQPVVGIALAGVATLSFGGFYAATLRARVAIASSFLLTFLVLLTYELTLTQLAVHFSDVNDATTLLTDLRKEVGVIIAFYFGSEAAIGVAKSIGVAVGGPDKTKAIMTSDRDVATIGRGDKTNVFQLKTPDRQSTQRRRPRPAAKPANGVAEHPG